MKHRALFLLTPLLFTACEAAGPTAAPIHAPLEAGQEQQTVAIEHHDSRQLANRMRGFLGETEIVLSAQDPSAWTVRGSAEEIALVRFLVQVFDRPGLDRGHRAVVQEFEESDARLALNRARGAEAWGDDWAVAAKGRDRWYAMIPDADLERFNAIVAGL